MSKHYMPQQLDAPMSFCLMTMDEWILFLPVLSTMALLFGLFVGIFTAVTCVMLVKKMKRDRGERWLAYWMYWHLPEMVKLKVTPPSYLREFIG